MYLRYDGLDLLLAIFLGTAGDPAQLGATTAYAYTYKWLTSIDGLFMTWVEVHEELHREYPSEKVVGITIKGQTGGALQLILKTQAINKIFDSSVNTLSSFNNVTIFESANRIRFAEGVFRMNDKDGAALSDSNIIYPESFELSAQRKMKGVYGQYKTAAPNVQDLIDEPTNDGMPTVTLKLTFPRHTGVTYLTASERTRARRWTSASPAASIASPITGIQAPVAAPAADQRRSAAVPGDHQRAAGIQRARHPVRARRHGRHHRPVLDLRHQPAVHEPAVRISAGASSPSSTPSQSASTSPSVSVSASPSSSPSASVSSSPSASA